MVKAATLETATRHEQSKKRNGSRRSCETKPTGHRGGASPQRGRGTADSGPWTEKTAEDDGNDSTTTAQRQRHAREATGPLTGTKQIHAYVHSTQYTAPAMHHQAATARDIRETMSKHAIVATEDAGRAN